MRRRWIVVAAVVACAGLAGQTGIAAAEGGNTHAAVSCNDLIKKYGKFNSAQANADLTKPTSLKKVYQDVAKVLNKLANSGPSSLRAAFKHLAAAYARLAKIDFSNPSSIGSLGGLFQQIQPDLQKIAAYFGSACHYTIPTT
jgi:hypothetical protein